jgi:hypothetical protein
LITDRSDSPSGLLAGIDELIPVGRHSTAHTCGQTGAFRSWRLCSCQKTRLLALTTVVVAGDPRTTRTRCRLGP